jgi:hypothetical protein
VGGIGQFGQVSGDSEQTQQTLWNYFGVDVAPALDDFKSVLKNNGARDAFKQVYAYAADQMDQELRNASPKDEANIVNNIATGITHFATLGDPKVELVDFSDGGFKILRFNKLVDKLKNIDLEATYIDSLTWPEVIIHERGNPKNRLLKIRTKIENKPKGGIYLRNLIEKGPLLEKLTEYRKASWDNETSTQALDRVTDKRLTGPGAKAAKSNAEPKMSADVLGREKRKVGK